MPRKGLGLQNFPAIFIFPSSYSFLLFSFLYSSISLLSNYFLIYFGSSFFNSYSLIFYISIILHSFFYLCTIFIFPSLPSFSGSIKHMMYYFILVVHQILNKDKIIHHVHHVLYGMHLIHSFFLRVDPYLILLFCF